MDAAQIITHLIALLIAIGLHEYAHAWAAFKLGDDTASLQGRLTLDPINHIDPMGGLLILFTTLSGFGFGWGRPVPVDSRNLKKPFSGHDVDRGGWAVE